MCVPQNLLILVAHDAMIGGQDVIEGVEQGFGNEKQQAFNRVLCASVCHVRPVIRRQQ